MKKLNISFFSPLITLLFGTLFTLHNLSAAPKQPIVKRAAKTRSCCGSESACCVTGKTCIPRTTKCYPVRSQSFDRARRLAGTVGYAHQFNVGNAYAWFSGTVEYQRSTRPDEIAEALFGSDLVIPDIETAGVTTQDVSSTRQIIIQGSSIQGADRNTKAWLADYFYLPRDYNSTLSMRPSIRTVVVDFDLYVGMDGLCPGIFFRAHGPVVTTRHNLELLETVEEDGVLAHPVGYFSVNETPRSSLLGTFEDYANGSSPDVSTTSPDSSIVFQPLQQAQLARFNVSDTGIGDIRLELGWNFCRAEGRHFGIYLQAATPISPKKNPIFLFGPVIGNQDHWELGGGFSGSAVVWNSVDGENHFGIAVDAVITYRFERPELRSFDLVGKPNSLYMLATKFGANGGNETLPLQIGGFDFLAGTCPNDVQGATKQFALEYAPVANLSTVNVNVGRDVQADLVIMANVTYCQFSIDIGYNFWTNTGPCIRCPDNCNFVGLCDPEQENTWALKGDARMFGFVDNTVTATPDDPIALSATQSKADIHNGTNLVPLDFSATDNNPNIDNPQDAVLVDDPQPCPADPAPFAVIHNRRTISNQMIKTSVDPVFLKCGDIDFVSSKSRSHKFFSHFGFNYEHDRFVTHAGVGIFFEAGRNKCAKSRKKKDGCNKGGCCKISKNLVTPTFWGIWLKGGASFN